MVLVGFLVLHLAMASLQTSLDCVAARLALTDLAKHIQFEAARQSEKRFLQPGINLQARKAAKQLKAHRDEFDWREKSYSRQCPALKWGDK
jgi:hypothetical protein